MNDTKLNNWQRVIGISLSLSKFLRRAQRNGAVALLVVSIGALLALGCDTHPPSDSTLPDTTLPDITPPAAVSALTAFSVVSQVDTTQQVTLSWTNPADSDFEYIEITWTPPDNNGIEILSAAESGAAGATADITIDGLTNDIGYTFTVVALDDSGNSSVDVSLMVDPDNPFALNNTFAFTLPATSNVSFALNSEVASGSGYYIDAPDSFSVAINDATLDSDTLVYGGITNLGTVYLADTWMALPPEDGTLRIDVGNDTTSDISGAMVRVRKSIYYLPFGDYSGNDLGYGPFFVLPPNHKITIELIEQSSDWSTGGFAVAFYSSGGGKTFTNSDLVGIQGFSAKNSTTDPLFAGVSVSDGALNYIFSNTPLPLTAARFRLSSAP